MSGIEKVFFLELEHLVSEISMSEFITEANVKLILKK